MIAGRGLGPPVQPFLAMAKTCRPWHPPRTERIEPASKDLLALIEDECQRREYGPPRNSVKATAHRIFQWPVLGPCLVRDGPIASTAPIL